jgi:thymidine kinase
MSEKELINFEIICKRCGKPATFEIRTDEYTLDCDCSFPVLICHNCHTEEEFE